MNADDRPDACPRCDSTGVVTVRTEAGPHHGKLLCAGCRKFRGWAPAPMTPERANAFVLPFGRIRGERLDAVAAGADGRDYLRWLAGHGSVKGGLRRAIELAAV